MRLVLNSCDKFESFTAPVNRYLNIVIIQTSCAVGIILYHTAHRNIKPQFLKYIKCNIHLTTSAIHHNKVWISRKSMTILESFPLTHTSCKTSCQNLTHALIIIRPLYCSYPELAIIILLWFSILKNNH